MAKRKIQLLRSGTIYSSYELAVASLSSSLVSSAGLSDGELVLARYSENDPENPEQENIKCVLGIFNEKNNLGSFTIIAGQSEINNLIESLDGRLDVVEAAIDALDLNTPIGGSTGSVVTELTQTDGQVGGSTTNVIGLTLDGYANDGTTNTGGIADGDTLTQALNKIENTVSSNKVTAGDGSIVMGTDSTNGNDTVAVNIKSGEHVLALSSTSGAEGLYTDLDLVKVTTNLPSNVKERYQLLATDDTQIGSNIDIYKDSALQSVKLLHADLSANPQIKPTYSNGTWTDVDVASQTEENLALCYAYLDVNGNTVVEAVPVGDFLRESEFGDGLTVSGGIVSAKLGNGLVFGSADVNDSNRKPIEIKLDSTTDSCLTLSSDGLKLDLSSVTTNALNVVNGSDAIGVTAKTNNEQTISVKLSDTTHNWADAVYGGKMNGQTVVNNNILQIKNDGLYLDSCWDCGEYY